MNPDKILIRYEQMSEQVEGPVKRIVGFVKAKNMLPLFDAADLEANPRSAKAGAVTEAIIESIRETPDTFPFKTKGILVGASDYDALDRKRYEVHFENPRAEGILDGGHNMLAIGTYILSLAIDDKKLIRGIRTWPDFKEAWHENRAAVNVLRKAGGDDAGEPGTLDFLIPLEIIVPSNLDDQEVVDDFKTSLLDICAARNNNVELRLETNTNRQNS